MLCHHEPPYNLEYLPFVERIKQQPFGQNHDLGIIVDLDSTDRLGSTAPYFEQCKRLIVVDHHVPHEAPGDLRVVDVESAATSVILTRLFLELEATISAEMATCLLTGIVTDTGSFRFRNTNAEALSLSAKLLECGGDINLVSEEIFQRKPLASTRLLGHLLEKMELDCDDRLCWGMLSCHDFAITGAKDEDTEGFANDLLSIRTVEIAALIREPRLGKVRVSLRSRGNHDVAEVAREFGGGGHQNAAGCSFDSHIENVVDALIPRLRQCLASS